MSTKRKITSSSDGIVPNKIQKSSIESNSTSFSSFNLKIQLLNGIENHGFVNPSPIQQKGIPIIIQGRDVIIQARSGSGKTATFCIGLLQQINTLARPIQTQALILLPTRELAIQTQQVLQSLGSYMEIRSTCCYGGKSDNIKNIEQVLGRGQHVVIGTPGRVLDMLRKGNITPKQIRLLILDEADQMFAMGLKEQLEKIRLLIPTTIQTVLLSATMPTDILALTDEVMKNPIKLLIKEQKDVTVRQISQYFIKVEADEWKFECLVDILESLPSNALAVIFCNTRELVEKLHKLLGQERNKKTNFPVCGFTHGQMEQKIREKNMKKFFSREMRILICTDLWARGMDVQQLDLVINFEMPEFHEVYIHRIGRTGRYGKSGVAINIVNKKEFCILEKIAKKYSIDLKPTPAKIKSLF